MRQFQAQASIMRRLDTATGPAEIIAQLALSRYRLIVDGLSYVF
jgi:hypothetical protein